ncbi:hypothetical protein BDN71DRAFT_1454343 [Pleurotus eryngii]|uniref:Uncharacterized protein n=1 Tax=Pleurotus eryngii TaxID=5323 RepID=A0A9P5ZNT8_PLEER|nr:hypothetical protein BDN71DRAFT_1454343 [Pleurotus eryngii]
MTFIRRHDRSTISKEGLGVCLAARVFRLWATFSHGDVRVLRGAATTIASSESRIRPKQSESLAGSGDLMRTLTYRTV